MSSWKNEVTANIYRELSSISIVKDKTVIYMWHKIYVAAVPYFWIRWKGPRKNQLSNENKDLLHQSISLTSFYGWPQRKIQEGIGFRQQMHEGPLNEAERREGLLLEPRWVLRLFWQTAHALSAFQDVVRSTSSCSCEQRAGEPMAASGRGSGKQERKVERCRKRVLLLNPARPPPPNHNVLFPFRL